MGDTVTDFFGPTSLLPSLKRKPKDDGAKQELLKQLSEQIGDFSAGKKFAPDTNDRPWEGPWDDEPQDKPKTEPNKKKVIVNKTITKEKETNTEPEKNKRFMEDLGKTTPEVDKKPETPEGDEGSTDWKKLLRRFGNSMVEGSEFARHNVNFKGNNPSAYSPGRTTERLEAAQNANDQLETNIDPESEINKQLGNLINERLAKRKQPGLGKSTMDREERESLIKHLDHQDKMDSDEAYRKAMLLSRKGSGGGSTGGKTYKPTDGDKKEMVNVGLAVNTATTILNDLDKAHKEGVLNIEGMNIPGKLKAKSGWGDVYDHGKGIKTPSMAQDALTTGGNLLFAALYTAMTGAAYNKEEGVLYNNLANKYKNFENMTFADQVKSLRQARDLLKRRQDLYGYFISHGELPPGYGDVSGQFKVSEDGLTPLGDKKLEEGNPEDERMVTIEDSDGNQKRMTVKEAKANGYM